MNTLYRPLILILAVLIASPVAFASGSGKKDGKGQSFSPPGQSTERYGNQGRGKGKGPPFRPPGPPPWVVVSPELPKVKNNNGHGNNLDGVDSSNPGKSKQGQDSDPHVDDERRYYPL
jgi:hypothetical protein